MTKLKTGVAIAIGSLFAGAAFAQSNYSIEQRDRIQDMRIEQGVRSGQLTGHEAARLERERAQVERMERRTRADGVVTPWERARIEQAQNRVGRDIYRESHDRQVANRGWGGSERSQRWEQRNTNQDRRFGQRDNRFGARANADGHFGRSDLAAGRQPHLQQTEAQRTQVQQAQTQRSWTRPAQTSSPATAASPVTVARQGGYSGRHSR